MRPLISFAASALRCARLRTSPATTAKPLALFTGAGCFNGSIKRGEYLFEKSDAFNDVNDVDDFLGASIDLFHGRNNSINEVGTFFSRTLLALVPRSLANLQLSAFCLTVAASSSIPEAVSSSVEALLLSSL